MSMVVIGSLVVLCRAGRGTAARVAIVAAAALWVGAVGSTRVYLGVQSPAPRRSPTPTMIAENGT